MNIDERLSSSAQPRLETLIGFQLRRASARSLADLEISLSDLGLRAVHYATLTTIERHSAINQGDLCRTIGMKQTNMVPIMNELIGRDMIHRATDVVDRRIVRFSLTGAAEQLIRELHDRVARHEDRFLHRLTRHQRLDLLALLSQLGDAAPLVGETGDRPLENSKI